MDAFTITLLGACGTALSGVIVALWNKLNKKEDQIIEGLRAEIERNTKEQNKVMLELLVAVKGSTELIFEAVEDIQVHIKALRKGR